MKIEFTKKDGGKINLLPQECWDIAERAYDLFVKNNDPAIERPKMSLRRGGLEIDVVVTRHLDFWRKWQEGIWEPNTFNIFDRYISPDVTYIDIGAWIGPTVLYASQRAGQAFALEPDPVAFAELEQNVTLNRKRKGVAGLKIFREAIAPAAGEICMGSPSGAGRSFSSVLLDGSSDAWKVKSVTLPEFLAREGISGRLFIKMDIEGFEYQLLPHLESVFRQFDTTLLVSFHSQILRSSLLNDNETFFNRFMRRLRFIRVHRALLKALPFKYFYSSFGEPLDLSREVRAACRTGSFVHDLVATNHE